MKINKFHRRGFTLLELIVVIVIVMVMTLISVGSYSVMQKRRHLRAAAEEINSAFVTARSYAVSRNAWHRVVFQLKDPVSGAESFVYWIDEINPNSSTTPNPLLVEPAVRTKITTPQALREGVRILDASVRGTTYTATAEANLVVRFQPNGSADQALVRIQEDSTSANTPQPIGSVRVHPATAKSKILADAIP